MTATQAVRRLRRERDGRPAAPVRIAHLGPGNFFRAHQAWYTEHAPDAADWGIAAFAGRRGAVARDLAAQDGLYTLLVRAADGDRPEVVSARAAGFGRTRRLAPLLRPPGAGAGDHHRDRGGLPARRRRRPGPCDPEVAADIAALRAHGTDAEVVTAPGKLALGLAVRRAHGPARAGRGALRQRS